jgi:hypothetical protein
MLLGPPDRAAIGALNPRAVVGYLKSSGWEQRGGYGKNAVFFGIATDRLQGEVLVPVASQSEDFPKVMEVLIGDLARFEDRPPYELLADLSMAAYDVVRVRSGEADSIGSIPLVAGVELHERTRDVVQYAANATAAGTKPRAAYFGRQSDRVTDYLNSLRLAQSQRGSFVISLLSPWDFTPSVDHGQLTLGDPFGRQVTRTLARSLQAIGDALKLAVTAGVQKPFEEAVRSGVSSNLCSALAQLAREGEGVDLSIRWSLTKPEEGHQPMLRLSREDAQSLSEAAESLSEHQPVPSAELEGVITNLKEEIASFDGKVTFDAVVSGAPRRVTMEFAKDDDQTRDTLIRAFQKRERIVVTGDLVRDGKRFRLESPHDLHIESETDLD